MSNTPPGGQDPVALTQLFLTNSNSSDRTSAAPTHDESADDAEPHSSPTLGAYSDDQFDDLDDSVDVDDVSDPQDDEHQNIDAAGDFDPDSDDEDSDDDFDHADEDDYTFDSADGYDDEDADEDDTGYADPAEAATFLGALPDAADNPAPTTDDEKPDTPARFSKPMVIGFVAVTVAVALGLSAAMVAMKPSHTVVSDQASGSAPQVAVVAAPAPSTPAPPNTSMDGPIPFQASADCPPGSTAAQAVAGTAPNHAWVCVRDGADGQVLTLDLGRPMKITAISIVPGWVGTDNAGADQWLQHRVVSRVTWILVNGNQRTPVPQNTGNVHGEAVQQMPSDGPDRGVLASQILMIVQQTSRAPADTPAPSPDPAATAPGGGPLPDILGAPLGGSSSTPPSPGTPTLGVGPGADSSNADPADNTFAVSSIKVIGHVPQ